MKRSPGSDVVDRIEQFDRNDNQIKWGSAIRPSPKMGSVVPVELVDERLAKLETTVSTLKKDCRSLSEQLVREKKKGPPGRDGNPGRRGGGSLADPVPQGRLIKSGAKRVHDA